MIVFVLGGARSGKSRFAQHLALTLAPNPVYLATSRVEDAEFCARVERHRADRGPEWTTIEEPVRLSGHVLEGRVVVVDCVTLWLANCFADTGQDVERALAVVIEEFERTVATQATWIFVSNELGHGVHAMTQVGRRFTDLQGWVNQRIAERADAVVLMVAGIPLLVKGVLPSSASRTTSTVVDAQRGETSMPLARVTEPCIASTPAEREIDQ